MTKTSQEALEILKKNCRPLYEAQKKEFDSYGQSAQQGASR